MLIAIMGDTFEMVTDDKENNARLTKLKIMGDYIYLINKPKVLLDSGEEDAPDGKG